MLLPSFDVPMLRGDENVLGVKMEGVVVGSVSNPTQEEVCDRAFRSGKDLPIFKKNPKEPRERRGSTPRPDLVIALTVNSSIFAELISV